MIWEIKSKWKISSQLTPHFERYWLPPSFPTFRRWKSSDFSFGKFNPLFLSGNLSCFYWVKIGFYFQFTFYRVDCVSKILTEFWRFPQPWIRGFFFLHLNYEHFRAPKLKKIHSESEYIKWELCYFKLNFF